MHSRDSLKAIGLKKRTLTIDGQEIRICEMSGSELTMLTELEEAQPSKIAFMKFAMSVANEDGTRMFDPTSATDLEFIASLGLGTIMPVVREFQSINGLDGASKNL